MIEGALLLILQALLLLNWPVAIILAWAAWKRPRVLALTAMAVLSVLIALTLTIYIWAVYNAGLGYPFPKELAQIVIRTTFIGFGLFPVWFLWLYFTGRFGRASED